MNIDLSGKTAVVTGAGGILAGHMAKGFARCGATVAVLDLRREMARKTVEAITAAGGTAAAFECDVLNKNSMLKAEQAVYETFGDYHILLNGAGGNRDCATLSHERFRKEDIDDPAILSYFDIKVEDFAGTMDLNFMGTYIPSQVFVKRMVEVSGASVINISSMTGFVPLTRSFAYGMAKGAVNSLTQFMAMHFGDTGLRVNAIAPGFIVTPMNKHMLQNEDGSYTARGSKVVAHTPMARLAQPEELVGAALFLADEKLSGFVTGVILPVDGGFLAAPGA